MKAPHHRALGVALALSLIATGCASRDSYVGEDHTGAPPPPKLKQDPRFAKETLEAQKRFWWP